jgi:hypothetical protein
MLYRILIYYCAYYTGIMSHVHVVVIFDIPLTNPLLTNLMFLILLLFCYVIANSVYILINLYALELVIDSTTYC